MSAYLFAALGQEKRRDRRERGGEDFIWWERSVGRSRAGEGTAERRGSEDGEGEGKRDRRDAAGGVGECYQLLDPYLMTRSVTFAYAYVMPAMSA
jgi:hypothetical protein